MKRLALLILAIISLFTLASCDDDSPAESLNTATNSKTFNEKYTPSSTISLTPKATETPQPSPTERAEPDFSVMDFVDDLVYGGAKDKLKNDGSTKVIYIHPFYRDVTVKRINHEAIVSEINAFRDKFEPVKYNKEIYSKIIHVYDVVMFDDGTYLAFADSNNGVMGKSLDKLNEYVHFDEEFASYISKLITAYPRRYYEGTWVDNKLEYTLYFDAADDVLVKLSSLKIVDDNLIATLETNYDGEKGMTLSIGARYSVDHEIGTNSIKVNLKGKKNVEIAMSLKNQKIDSANIYVALSNTVYWIRTFK